jgi:hypothetical protein
MNLKRSHKEKKPKEKEKTNKQFAKRKNRWKNGLSNIPKSTSKPKERLKRQDKKSKNFDRQLRLSVAAARVKIIMNLSQTKSMSAKANKKNQKETEKILHLFQKILIKNKIKKPS